MLIAPSPIPRFEARVPVPAATLVERAAARRTCHEPKVHVLLAGQHIELLVDEADRHYWSPWLSVTLEETEDGAATVVHGRFGPHPAVWTLFVSIQIFWLFVLVCALIAAASVITLGWSPLLPLLAVPGAVVGMVLTYLGSLVGQRLGKDQLDLLHRALDDLIQADTRG